MNYLRKRVRKGRVTLAVVALMPLAIVVGTMSPAVTAYAATPSQPACQASQITLTTGATMTDTTYPVRTSTGVHQSLAYEAVPVYFYNRGAVCHLLMGAPDFQAVRNTTEVAKLSALAAHDVSVPAGADNTRRPVVAHHQKIEALFVVTKPVGRSFAGCDPATATGIVVQGYANPIGTFHFVVRRLLDVCFDTGAGRNVLDFGAVWPAT
jgi:hypothetical protein